MHHQRRRTESSGDEDMGLEMSMVIKGKGKEVDRGKAKEKTGETRKKKERLLREHLEESKARKGTPRRQKSMVSLASEDDLLGRRMLGLAGPLTGRGDDGRVDE